MKQQAVAGVRLAVLLALLAGCGGQAAPAAPAAAVPTATASAAQAPGAKGDATMQITSSAFTEGSPIPSQYTCDGANVSLPLAWTGMPANAQALALIFDDPDAPAGTWTHWVVFNLPAKTAGLPEGVAAGRSPAEGAVQGSNSYRKAGYNGPCPPGGSTHRYYCRLYALDGPLSLTNTATAQNVRDAMQGHVVAEAQLMGRYQRKR